MTGSPNELVLSTDSVPGRDRLAWFREEVCAKLGTTFEPLDESPVDASITLRQCGEVAMAQSESRGGTRIRRTRPLIRTGNIDTYIIGFQSAGSPQVTWPNREFQALAGDCFFVNPDNTALVVSPLAAAQLTLNLPRDRLATLLPGCVLDRHRYIPTTGSPGRLLAVHLRYLWRAVGQSNMHDPPGMLLAACHLVALALGASARKIDGTRASLNLARREMALDLVRKSFTDPRFNARHAAARLGLSRRSLYRLFEAGELSFSECVRVRRLAQAYRLLATGDTPVTQAAFAAGFNDLSTFNRAFRARYGITPREVPLNLRDQAGQ